MRAELADSLANLDLGLYELMDSIANQDLGLSEFMDSLANRDCSKCSYDMLSLFQTKQVFQVFI